VSRWVPGVTAASLDGSGVEAGIHLVASPGTRSLPRAARAGGEEVQHLADGPFTGDGGATVRVIGIFLVGTRD